MDENRVKRSYRKSKIKPLCIETPKEENNVIPYDTNLYPIVGNRVSANFRMKMNSIKSARCSLARVLRMYYRRELEAEEAKVLIYGMNSMIAALKTEKEYQVLDKVIELENLAKMRNTNEH